MSWISAAERLPPVDELVWICDEHWTGEVWFGKYTEWGTWVRPFEDWETPVVRWWHPLHRPAGPDKVPCVIEDCDGVPYARGWCRNHYNRWYRYGDPRGFGSRERRDDWPEVCTIDDCKRKSYCRGWCSRHYNRWRRYGDPLGTAEKLPTEEHGNYRTENLSPRTRARRRAAERSSEASP